MRRVVITGLGIIASTGKDVDTFFCNLIQGCSGVRRITQFDPSELRVQIAAEVPSYTAGDYFPPKRRDLLDRSTEFALIAAGEAMRSSGIQISESARCRFGVMTGCGMGGVHTYETAYFNLYGKNASRVHPFTIVKSMHNAATAQISMEYGAQGPSLAISTAGSSAGHAIGQAFHSIKFGVADVMLAGGSEAPITFGTMRCWEPLRVMATGNEGDPGGACRPFSANREGFVVGEGAGMVLLEELGQARKRRAKIYAELAGYGVSSDAGHIARPTVDGPARAIHMALEEARVPADGVDYINAHGTGTRINDAVETQVIKEVLKDHARRVAISSTKSMHGHAMGATAAIELVATVMAMERGVIPPTANYTERDPECDLDYVPNQAREKPIRVAISDSFAFGGLNTVLLTRRLE